MWNNKKISVILPTYNEKRSIRQCINAFEELGIIDEILVVNNNAVKGTSAEITGTTAIEVFEGRQGYGSAIRRGFLESTGDLLVVCEPDGTFTPSDLYKLLAYSEDYEIVFGSRTVKEFIWSGANMGAFLRWGNYAVAKLLEFLFNTNSLTDVGCTLRLISKSALEIIEPHFKIYDNYFGPEMILLAARSGISFVQIPVNYKSRVGVSSVTGSKIKAFILGWQMIFLIFRHRMDGSIFNKEKHIETIAELFMTYKFYYFFAGIFSIALILMIKPLSEPLVGDASLFILLINDYYGWNSNGIIDLYSGKDIWHPFLYQSLLLIVSKFFSYKLVYLRMIGLVCLVINVYLIRKIALEITRNQAEQRILSFLSIALYLLIPSVIDLGLHIDIDNTVMGSITLIFAYLFIRYLKNDNNILMVFSLSITMALGLWAKLTTPLLFPMSIFVYFILMRQFKSAIAIPLTIACLGGLIFYISWYQFCEYMGFPNETVFLRMFGVLFSKTESSMKFGPQFIRELSILIFTINPIVLILWISGISKVLKYVKRENINEYPILYICIISLLIFFGYMLVGRVVFGVPKYIFPMIPFLCLLIGFLVMERVMVLTIGRIIKMVPVLIVATVVYFLLADPIQLANAKMKILYVDDSQLSDSKMMIAAIFAMYLLPFAVIYSLKKKLGRETVSYLCIIFLTGQLLGFNLKQSFGDWMVTYNYGYRGAIDIQGYLPESGRIFCPEGMVISPNGSISEYIIDNGRFIDFTEWKKYIESSSPDTVIFGPAANNIEQMKKLYKTREFHSYMDESYRLIEVNDYGLYLKR